MKLEAATVHSTSPDVLASPHRLYETFENKFSFY